MSYVGIAALYDELDNGGNPTDIRKKIGKEIKENNLDTRLCDLIAKSNGVRSVLFGFHDDEVLDVDFDNADCQIVLRGFHGGYVRQPFDCPYRLKFLGVVECTYSSKSAFVKESYYCQREELNMLHDGNIRVEFVFSNNNSKKYVPQTVHIICKDVAISAAPEFKDKQ